MLRKIIKIDEERCNGCGACAEACHEGAIKMIDGKARLLREDYCDGLGNCLPACPTEAISFEEREAPAYDEQAVLAAKAQAGHVHSQGGCPGSRERKLTRKAPASAAAGAVESRLTQWPVQIKLINPQSSCFDDARLLVAADCTAFAYGNFHQEFIRSHVTLIGCPKLDMTDYSEKLTEILRANSIKSVTVVRMEVPCCGGIEQAVKQALQNSGKMIPWQVVVISTDGQRIKE